MILLCLIMAAIASFALVIPAFAGVSTPELDSGTLSGLVSAIVGSYVAYRSYAAKKQKK